MAHLTGASVARLTGASVARLTGASVARLTGASVARLTGASVARLTVPFHLLSLGSKSLLIPELGTSSCSRVTVFDLISGQSAQILLAPPK